MLLFLSIPPDKDGEVSTQPLFELLNRYLFSVSRKSSYPFTSPLGFSISGLDTDQSQSPDSLPSPQNRQMRLLVRMSDIGSHAICVESTNEKRPRQVIFFLGSIVALRVLRPD